MKSTARGIALVLLPLFNFVYAGESSLLGRYTGTFQTQDNYTPNRMLGMTLVIDKVAEGRVEATGQVHARGPCFAQFPMVGALKGNELQLETVAPAGKESNCPMVLRMTVDGSRLEGTIGRSAPIRLSK